MVKHRAGGGAFRYPTAVVAALALAVSGCAQLAGAEGAEPAPAQSPYPAAVSGDTGIEIAALPDITARPITIGELESMLPADASGAGIAAGPTPAEVRSNERLTTTAVLDRADEAADIARFRRITGVASSYPGDDASAHVWIDLFESPAGASGWVADTAGDIVKRAGGSHRPDIAVTGSDEYPWDGPGSGGVGLVLTLDDGARTETLLLFHMGRIAVFASVVRPDGADTRVQVRRLAEEAAGRVLAVLQASGAAPASGGPLSYDFEFRRVVEIGSERWTTVASGTVAGSSVSCRVRVEYPWLETSSRLTSIGGRIWEIGDGGDHTLRGGANAEDRVLLSLCPPWPVGLEAAGLVQVISGDPAIHDFDGIAARGYRGTTADLGVSLGLDTGPVTVKVFNVWVTGDPAWLVALDLAVSGDSRALAPLIGPGFPEGKATVLLSHRITSPDRAAPVTPPG